MAWGISWFLGNGMGSMIQCEMSWIAHSHSGMAEASEERALGGRQGGHRRQKRLRTPNRVIQRVHHGMGENTYFSCACITRSSAATHGSE